jgi:tetratricopeptide (TPR) repeat protein
MRGHVSEGRAWLEAAIACESLSAAVTLVRGKALNGAGGLAWSQGDYARARRAAVESVAIFRELGDKHWIAHALSTLALIALGQANVAEARVACDESIALFQAVNDRWGEAFTLRCLGDAALLSDDPIGARAKYEESLSLWRMVGDPWGLAMPLNDLGRVTGARGDFKSACTYYEESVTLLRQVGHKWSLALVLMGLGHATLHLSDLSSARASFDEGLTIWRELGNRTGIIQCVAAFAALAAMERQPRRAAQLFGAASALFKSIGFPLEGTTRIEFERNVAVARTQLGDAQWTVAWNDGQALPLDQAIALALA